MSIFQGRRPFHRPVKKYHHSDQERHHSTSTKNPPLYLDRQSTSHINTYDNNNHHLNLQKNIFTVTSSHRQSLQRSHLNCNHLSNRFEGSYENDSKRSDEMLCDSKKSWDNNRRDSILPPIKWYEITRLLIETIEWK